LALDHLQDPQNFGALCRTAEGLGVDGILLPKDRSVTVTAGVYHASVGAVETIPIIQVVNLNEALRQLKEAEFWIVGTALSEQSHDLDDTPDFDKKASVS
jgi:23S rRNA (guanosine2251-2'-O)-methyltransferase